MSKKRLERVYDVIINSGSIITERTFLINGISNPKTEIDYLVASGILVMESSEQYKLASVEELYEYGLKLFTQGYILRANLCFEKCHHIDKTHRDSCLQIFLLALKNKKYLNAYEVLDAIMAIEPDKYMYENNLLLYLLSSISDECPSRYEEQVKNMRLKDILSPNEKNPDIKEMKKEIMKGKYPHAMYLFNNICAKNIKYTASSAILRELITQAIHKEKEFRQHIANLIDQKAYHSLVLALEQKQNRRHLNIYDKQIYTIAKAITYILNTKTIPPIEVIHTNDFYKALKGNNFSLATELNQRFVGYTQKTKDAEILEKLLTEINLLISELQEEQVKIDNDDKGDISDNVPSTLSLANTLKEAREAYNKNDFLACINICLEAIKIPEYKCSEMFILLSLSYYNTNNQALSLQYLNQAKEYNDYHQINNAVKPTTSSEQLKKEQSIKAAEEIAYYFKEINSCIDNKKIGLLSEQILLIKLIYARDYYIEGNYEEGDKLVNEVEQSFSILDSDIAKSFLIEVKTKRNYYQQMDRIRRLSLTSQSSN